VDPDEPPVTRDRVIEELGLRGGGDGQTISCIIELAGEPVGLHPVLSLGRRGGLPGRGRAEPAEGAWGSTSSSATAGSLDGGSGRGVRLLSDHLFADESATVVALITEATNARSHAAYRHAGMRVAGEPFLDTDSRAGQRVESILMIRERPDGTAGGR